MSAGTLQLDAWRRSAIWREISRRQCQKMNAAHAAKPRCGANAKSTGEPCRMAAMANGRCKSHGGRTPSGAKWHKPAFPEKDGPNAIRKIDRKAADLAKAERRRAKRVAAMPPAELERYRAWQKAHRPGDPKKRAADRERRRQDREAAKMIAASSTTSQPATSEAARIADEIAMLRAELARRAEPEAYNWGVFA